MVFLQIKTVPDSSLWQHCISPIHPLKTSLPWIHQPVHINSLFIILGAKQISLPDKISKLKSGSFYYFTTG